MNRPIHIHLDGEERVLMPGMKVRHLLTPEEIEKVLRGELAVVDSRGHERGLDGAISEGVRLFRRTIADAGS